RSHTLEARCVKLEQDYRTVAQARDKARKDLTALEEENARLKSEAADRDALVKERDEARHQAETVQTERDRTANQLQKRTAERDQIARDLHVRTAERDTALNRYEKLRKTLQTLVAQDEGAPQQQQQQQQNTDTTTHGTALGGNS